MRDLARFAAHALREAARKKRSSSHASSSHASSKLTPRAVDKTAPLIAINDAAVPAATDDALIYLPQPWHLAMPILRHAACAAPR
jgi:hypothetical protein